MWSQLREKLPKFISDAHATYGLDTTVDDAQLKNIFANMRHRNGVGAVVFADSRFQTEAVVSYLKSGAVVAMGQALNHYFDSVMILDECKSQNVLISEQATRARVQSALSLALLYWTRVISRSDSVIISEHKVVFAASLGLLRRLRSACADYDTFSSADTAKRYSRCMLWALYIGAWSEQMRRPGNDCDDPKEEWFGSRLASHASEMGFCSWQDVREVLLGFIYNDNLPLNGSLWFHKVLKLARVEVPLRAD